MKTKRTAEDIALQKEVGERLRKCLDVRYETHRELAYAVGVSEALMSRFLCGHQQMTYHRLRLAAAHLGVSVAYLLGEREKADGGDLRDAFNKRIDEGYDIVWRFDPRDCSKMTDYLLDIGEGLLSMDALHDACGVPKALLGDWFELMRRREWDILEKEIKNYGKALDSV